VFTFLKVLGLMALIGSTLGGASNHGPTAAAPYAGFSVAHFGTALVACLWAYNGWFTISLVGGEIRNPQRNLPRSIVLGTVLVTLVYALANWGYLRTMSLAEIAGADRVAAAAASRTMGAVGAAFVAIIIAISTLATTNANTLTGSRLYFAQARDGLWFRRFGEVHPAFETPHIALVGQGIWTAILALSGSYLQLISYATITFWIFYAMTIAGLMMLRRKTPEALRPYRMFGYPVTAVLFLAVSGGIVISACISAPAPSAAGIFIVASGVPAYYLWRHRH
jgi:amino acid transporter